MYQVLVNKHNGTVLQFLKGGHDDQFEVHEDFMWVQYLDEMKKVWVRLTMCSTEQQTKYKK